MRRRRSAIGKERAEKEEARTSRHDVEPDDDYYDRLEEEWAEVDATLLLDWTLIDEISLPLLERGIGTFDVLQRALPTVVFARIERIVPVEQRTNRRHNDNEGEEDARDAAGHDRRLPTAATTISDVRALKLFRIAQLQLRHLLSTQHQLLNELDRRHRRICVRAERERWRDTAAFGKGAYRYDSRTETCRGTESMLFKCNACGKIFVDAQFLADHLRRRHAKDLSGGTRELRD